MSEPPGKPKNPGMGSPFLLQGIFPTQEWNRVFCIGRLIAFLGLAQRKRASPRGEAPSGTRFSSSGIPATPGSTTGRAAGAGTPVLIVQDQDPKETRLRVSHMGTNVIRKRMTKLTFWPGEAAQILASGCDITGTRQACCSQEGWSCPLVPWGKMGLEVSETQGSQTIQGYAAKMRKNSHFPWPSLSSAFLN